MRFPLLLIAGLLLPDIAHADQGNRLKQLEELTAAVADLGKHVPAELRREARCVSMLTVAKGGFIVGGTGGTGFLSCREPGKAEWSAPAVLDVGGPSAGAQIGGSKTTLMMVFVNIDDIEAVARATPVFQGGAEATAGTASKGVAYGGNPEIAGGAYSVAKSEGLYAGAVWQSLVISPSADKTRELYG
jgi:lipid-binding SYLF domain-containing protein